MNNQKPTQKQLTKQQISYGKDTIFEQVNC